MIELPQLVLRGNDNVSLLDPLFQIFEFYSKKKKSVDFQNFISPVIRDASHLQRIWLMELYHTYWIPEIL